MTGSYFTVPFQDQHDAVQITWSSKVGCKHTRCLNTNEAEPYAQTSFGCTLFCNGIFLFSYNGSDPPSSLHPHFFISSSLSHFDQSKPRTVSWVALPACILSILTLLMVVVHAVPKPLPGTVRCESLKRMPVSMELRQPPSKGGSMGYIRASFHCSLSQKQIASVNGILVDTGKLAEYLEKKASMGQPTSPLTPSHHSPRSGTPTHRPIDEQLTNSNVSGGVDGK